MKTLLFYFSDIHLTGEKPENEGAVLSAFCDDFKHQLQSIPHDDALVLIGGDLVHAADNSNEYTKFYDNVLKKLIAFGIENKTYNIKTDDNGVAELTINNTF